MPLSDQNIQDLNQKIAFGAEKGAPFIAVNINEDLLRLYIAQKNDKGVHYFFSRDFLGDEKGQIEQWFAEFIERDPIANTKDSVVTQLPLSEGLSMFSDIGAVPPQLWTPIQEMAGDDAALTHQLIDVIKKSMSQRWNRDFHSAAYEGTEIFDLVANSHTITNDVFNFLYNDESKTERRVQAIQSFPVLADLIAYNAMCRKAVDGELPLRPALQSVTKRFSDGKLSKGVFKKLSRAPSDLDAPKDKLLGFLAKLPPDWVPDSGDQWRAMVPIMNLVEAIDPYIPEGTDTQKLLAGAKGDWVEYSQKIAAAYTDTRPPQGLTQEEAEAWVKNRPAPDSSPEAIVSAGRLIGDMANECGAKMVLPVRAALQLQNGDQPTLTGGAIATSTEAACEFLFAGRSLTSIFEQARHWHTQRARLEAEMADAGLVEITREQTDEWKPYFPASVTTPTGIEIVLLRNEKELREEGQLMSHCVGGYSGNCRSGRSRIFSLRKPLEDGNFERLSTLELRVATKGDPIVSHNQHYAENDTRPSDEAIAAKEWFERAVNTDQIHVERALWAEDYMKKGNTEILSSSIHLICGYDWRDEQNRRQAISGFSDYISKKWKTQTFDKVTDHIAEKTGLSKDLYLTMEPA